jgi:hypothetical protein
MDIKKKFDELQNLDLGRLTIPGWILILVALGVSITSGCTMASLTFSVVQETGQSRSLIPAGVIFLVLLFGIFYGGSWVMKLCGIPVLRDR